VWIVILFDNLGFELKLPYPSKGLNVVCDLRKRRKRKGKVILLSDGLSFAYPKTSKCWMWVKKVTKEALTDVPKSSTRTWDSRN
jgi:hypothetical protein